MNRRGVLVEEFLKKISESILDETSGETTRIILETFSLEICEELVE